MYQESIDLLSEQESYKPDTINFNSEYISLIEKTVELTKASKNDRTLELVSLAMANELPSYCSSYYLELAFSIKKTELKIRTLSLVFEKLSGEEKVLVREEIKKAFKSIRSPKSQWKILFHIRNTKDKELISFYQELIEKLVLLNEPYLYQKALLVQELSNCLEDPMEIKRLQKRALELIPTFGETLNYWILIKVLNNPLIEEIRQEIVSYAVANWYKLKVELSTRVYMSGIFKHFPSDVAQSMREELYQEVIKLADSKNKTEVVKRLASLGSRGSSLQEVECYRKAVSIIKDMKEKDSISEEALYPIAFNCPDELALEIGQVLLEKFNPCSNPRLLVILLTRLLSKIQIEEKRTGLAGKILSLITKEKERFGLDGALSHFPILVQYIEPKRQQHFASFVFHMLLRNASEEKQAKGFGYLAKYLDKEDKSLLLSAINKMESANKATALAGVLAAFEGKEFLSLAARLLDLVAASINKQINNLTIGLIPSIGKQLNKESFLCQNSPQ